MLLQTNIKKSFVLYLTIKILDSIINLLKAFEENSNLRIKL